MCPEETELVSLSTGTVDLAVAAKHLLGVHQVGEEAYQMFKKKCLEVPPTMKFHDKMTKQNLKMFSNVNANKKSQWKKNSQRGGPEVEINLFGHMILVAQSRQLHWLTHYVLCPDHSQIRIGLFGK